MRTREKESLTREGLPLPSELYERIEKEERWRAFSSIQRKEEEMGFFPTSRLYLPRLAPYLTGLGGILLGILLGLISLVVGFVLVKKF